MRALPRLALAALACATAANAEPPPLPAPLAGTVVAGEFQPGDLGWLRGRFADATKADKARLTEVKEWLELCAERATARERTELADLGAEAPALSTDSYGEGACAQIQWYATAKLPAEMTFETFTASLAEVRPIFRAWTAGAEMGAATILPRDDPVGLTIKQAVAKDQALRKAIDWKASGGPELPDPLIDILRLLIGAELSTADLQANAKLKEVVAEHGWPTIDGSGKDVSAGAWLLVQHADRDPSWQVEALRLLQPLALEGRVSARDTAYLTDRVQVNLTGRQTYGTQFWCVDGKSVPRPIDDEAGVDARRTKAELGTLAEYRKTMAENFGDRFCPPAAPPK